jgi:type I restriction enzyme R subunit
VTGEAERETREQRINPRLDRAGWDVRHHKIDWASLREPAALEEFPTASGPADYMLADCGQVLGAVEAKKVGIGPQEVLGQAKRYSKGISQEPVYGDGYRVPFLYSTNGEEIWFLDARHSLNTRRQLAGFHTPGALHELLTRNYEDELSRLERIPQHESLWEFQAEACDAMDKAIRDRKRKMLLPMATGTGKTRTLVNQAYRLMKAGVARRVLFLVDRRALAAQAVQAFASFEAEPGLKFDKIYPLYHQRFQRDDVLEGGSWDPGVMPSSLLTNPKLGDTFVYICTVQRMTINLFGRGAAVTPDDEAPEEDAERLQIPIHAFDLIIADECHRGYTAKQQAVWRDTLDYFDAIKIGLTATPAAHTTTYFEHVPYRYEYERAVREGHLVDYDAVRIASNVRINGVFLHEGDQIDEVDPETGSRELDLLEADRQYDAAEIEETITAPNSNEKILGEIKRYAELHEAEYGRFPKTLIFAVHDLQHISHADQLVRLARNTFGRGDDFVAKITGKVDRPLQRIREFRNRPNPGIAVTVDLLTTGIDIPDLEFLVFLRPVQSRILFEQMLGRGTRKGEHFSDKDKFVVFDCFDGTLLEFFRNTTGMTVVRPEGDGKPIAAIIDEIWQNIDRDYNVRRLVRRLRRIGRRMSGPAYELFARFIPPDGDLGAWSGQLPGMLRSSFASTMRVLRDPEFQRLLKEYPRPPRRFVVAPTVVDQVESELLIRGADGREYKPSDYLAAFCDFVCQERDKVPAIGILLDHPQDWGPGVLTELREALDRASYHFTERNLRRAFEAVERRPLVDIISMVKRAATADSSVLTAEERAERAVQRVSADRRLTTVQITWLGHIRRHLAQNLSIDAEDFDLMPVLADRGGWGRANRVFQGELDDLIKQLNQELAAI